MEIPSLQRREAWRKTDFRDVLAIHCGYELDGLPANLCLWSHPDHRLRILLSLQQLSKDPPWQPQWFASRGNERDRTKCGDGDSCCATQWRGYSGLHSQLLSAQQKPVLVSGLGIPGRGSRTSSLMCWWLTPRRHCRLAQCEGKGWTNNFKAMFTWRDSTRHAHESNRAFTWQSRSRGRVEKAEKCM